MIKKGALTGLLLFGIFFGAGNLIFPPTLGALSGEHFWSAIAEIGRESCRDRV